MKPELALKLLPIASAVQSHSNYLVASQRLVDGGQGIVDEAALLVEVPGHAQPARHSFNQRNI